MTKAEAAEFLSVPETATRDEVQARYEEMFSDYQIRLTNAPTPALRKVYQRNLEQLRTTVDVFYPGFVVASPQDLPATEPVMGTRDEAASARSARGAATAAGASAKAGTRAQVAAPVLEESSNTAVNIAVAAAAVLGALAILFGILWYRGSQDAESLRGFLALDPEHQMAYVAKNPDFSPSLTSTFALLQNGQFAVCNDSASPIDLTWIIASYRAKDGTMHTFNSKNYPVTNAEGKTAFMRWHLNANGGRQAMTMSQGSEMVWDGSVLAYSLGVLFQGQEYVKGGAWAATQGGCVHVNY